MDTIPLLPDFLALLRFLSAENVEYLLVGGMAVNFYGYHRSTGDLDLWVAVTPENQDRLAAALRRFGFSEQTVARRPLLEKPKFLRIGQQPVRVEIHSEISGVEFDACFARAVRCNIGGVEVPFISLADLRKNKRAAGRAKDLADLEALPEDKESDA
jgi:predicted nucleotidyltransferase